MQALQPSSEIQIKDKLGPFHFALSAKKSFEKVRQIRGADSDPEGGPVFLVLDRYRFEVVQVALEQGQKERGRSKSRPRSRSLRRQNSTGLASSKVKTGLEALRSLRQTGKIVHCSFSESRQHLCMFLADRSLATFDFDTEQLSTNIKLPQSIVEKTKEALDRIASQAGTLSNKLTKGAKLHSAVQSQTEAMDFFLYEPVFSTTRIEQEAKAEAKVVDCQGRLTKALVFCSASHGHQLIKADCAVSLVQPGYLASSFIVNKNYSLNVCTDIRLNRVTAQTLYLTYRCLVFQLDHPNQIGSGVPILIKQEKVSFKIANRTNARTIEDAEKLLTGKVETCSYSLVSVITVGIKGDYLQTNVMSKSEDQVFMIDVFKKQTVIELTKRIHGDLSNIHVQNDRAAKVKDIQWTELERLGGQQLQVVLISFQNGFVVCFDQDGQQVKLLSDALFGQNVIGNFDYFTHRAGIKLSQKSIWCLHETCISLFDGLAFQSFRVEAKQSAFQKPAQLPADLRRCCAIGKGFPMATVSDEVVLDSRLFERSERVFWHFHLACKLYQTGQQGELDLYKILFQGFNTLVFFLKYDKFILAYKTLDCISTDVFASLNPIKDDFRKFPQSNKSIKVQLLQQEKSREGRITRYNLPKETTTLVNKSALLQQLAGFFICKLVRVKQQRERAVKKKLLDQDGRLMPEQVAHEQYALVQIYKVTKSLVSKFFRGRGDFWLRAFVAKSIGTLKSEKERKALTNTRKLKELSDVVLSRLPDLNVAESSNQGETGSTILQLLLASQKCAQGGLSVTKDAFNFANAVEIFKKDGLQTPANEFVFALQLIRQIQESIARSILTRSKNPKEIHVYRACLPSALEVIQSIKGNKIIDLQSLPQMHRVLGMRSQDARLYGQQCFSTCFALFFADSNQLLASLLGKSTQTLDELLFLSTVFNEVKDHQMQTQGNVFAKLLQIFQQGQYSLQSSVISLKFILDAAPGVIETESKVLNTIKTLLFSQRIRQDGVGKPTKFPHFISYMLRNVNKMPVREFKQVKVPTGMQLDPSKAKTTSFLLSSLVALCCAFKCDFSINTNALLNAPTIQHGILEAMTLQNIVSKTQLRDSNTIDQEVVGVDQAKKVIWELILWLWLIQCQFMVEVKKGNPLLQDQAKPWRVRALAVMKTLQRDKRIDTESFIGMLMQQGTADDEDSNDSYCKNVEEELGQVSSIYFDQHELLDPLTLISRAFTDVPFSQFILKIPTIFTHYNAKSHKQLSELDIRVKRRVRDIYWQRYLAFRDVYGLKLNYSLKIERGLNLVHMVKRGDRKMFKSEDSATELTIKQLEKEVLEKDKDASFISDDLFNKSMTSLVGMSSLDLKKEIASFHSGGFNEQAEEELKSSHALVQIQDLSAIEHLNDCTIGDRKALIDNFHREEEQPPNQASSVIISQQSLQNDLKGRGLIDAFEDTELQQRDSAPLPRIQQHSGTWDKIESKEVVLNQFGTSEYQENNNEPVVMDFKQTNLNFLSNQGRVLSPLDLEAALNDVQDLDRSEHDQLQVLEQQFNIGKKDAHQRGLKKGLRMLERFVWKKHTQRKFGVLYHIQAFLESGRQAEKIAALKQLSQLSGSNKDDSTSMGQVTGGAMSTLPTVQDRGRGRGGRGTGHHSPMRDEPDFNASDKERAKQKGMNHTQRTQGNWSPKFSPNTGRGKSVGRNESSFSREDEHSGFRTITLHEDDEFYQAYINRGKGGSPMTQARKFETQRHRFQQEFSTGRQEEEEPGTSRFDDSRYGGQASTEGIIPEAEPMLNWQQRRNRFLDLHLHVGDLRSRIVRTPEQQTRHTHMTEMLAANSKHKKLSHSPRPTRTNEQKTKKSKHASVLDQIKLFKVVHPSAIDRMKQKSDILFFKTASTAQQTGRPKVAGVSTQSKSVRLLNVPQQGRSENYNNVGQERRQETRPNERKARFIHFAGAANARTKHM